MNQNQNQAQNPNQPAQVLNQNQNQDAQFLNPWIADDPILPDDWNNGENPLILSQSDGDSQANQNQNQSQNPHQDFKSSQPDNQNPANFNQNPSQPDNQNPANFNQNQDLNQNQEQKRVYHLKVNHQERDVELSDAEVIARLQKSYAFDEWKQPADLNSQIAQTKKLFPDLNEIPEEVAESVANGSPFLNAYTAYRIRESERRNTQISLENAILRQNQDAMRRAPVRSVTAGGSVQTAPLSDFERGFERGFDSEIW